MELKEVRPSEADSTHYLSMALQPKFNKKKEKKKTLRPYLVQRVGVSCFLR
jgi:hypothetical protein